MFQVMILRVLKISLQESSFSLQIKGFTTKILLKHGAWNAAFS